MDPRGLIFPDNDGGEESFTIRGEGGGDANETVVKKKLFTAAMKEKWEEVVSIYTANSSIRAHKITNSGDTVLHVAIESGKKNIIKQLLSLIPCSDENDTLNQKNDKKNTPLHLAAALGMADVCMEMAKKYPELVVKARNELGETPLFVAARHGKIDAFFALQSIVESNTEWYDPEHPPETRIPSYCRRQYDGNTILHVAITFEHLGEAGAGQSEQQTDHFSASRFFPENYGTCIEMLQVAVRFLLIIPGIGLWRIKEVKKKKIKHVYACQIMDELVDSSQSWEHDGNRPPLADAGLFLPPSVDEENQPSTSEAQMQATSSSPILGQDKAASSPIKTEADKPILVAAMRGVTEMVEKILNTFPVAIQDTDDNDKNIVLLAIEHRQLNVYNLMLKRNIMKENVFGKVDKKGNSALHLAATLGQTRPWTMSGAALQMQWEIKWFKYVQNSVDPEFLQQRNSNGKTAGEIFTEMHKPLVKDGGTWLADTSKSCSGFAALIATVAFASATTVPGGVDNKSGLPVLEGQVAFQIFALSALFALCFSVASLVMFLSILISSYREMDFEVSLPAKMIFGLTLLFLSVGSMLVSFCSGNFYVVERKLDYVAYPIYGVMGVSVSFFAIAQFLLYVDLIKATFSHVPERTEKVQTHGLQIL